MSTKVDRLEESINHLKKELIQIVEETGLNSHETLFCSQTLDQFLTIYQKGLLKGKIEYINGGSKCL